MRIAERRKSRSADETSATTEGALLTAKKAMD